MLNRLFTAGALTLGLVAPLALAVSPASADTPKCVSKAEFRAVEKGWSMERVTNRFDVPGKQVWFASGDAEYDIPAAQGREYNACPNYSYISVDFEKEAGDKWRVTRKYAYWG